MAKAWLVAALVVCALCATTTADVEELSQTEVVGMDEGAEQTKVNAMEVLEKGANPAEQNAKNQPARAETKEELQAKKDKAAAKSAKAKAKKAAEKQEEKAKEKKADKKAAAEAKNKDKKSSAEGGGLPRSDLNWKTDEQKKNEEVVRQLAAEKAARAKKALPKKGLKGKSKKQQKNEATGKTKNAADEREKAKLDDHKGEAAEEQREKEQAEKRRKEGHIPPRGAEDATAKKRREQTPTIVDPVKTKVISNYESVLKANGLDEYDNFKQKPNRVIKKKDKKNDMAKSDALTIAQRRMSRAQNKNGRGSACADGDCPPRESRNGAPDMKDMNPPKNINQKGKYVKGMNNAFKTQPPPTIVKKHPPKFKARKPPCPHEELGLEHDVEDFLLD